MWIKPIGTKAKQIVFTTGPYGIEIILFSNNESMVNMRYLSLDEIKVYRIPETKELCIKARNTVFFVKARRCSW